MTPTADALYAFTGDCTACGACLLTCPEHAIVVGMPLSVRADRCTGCGECIEICPADAVIAVPVVAVPVVAVPVVRTTAAPGRP